MPEKETNLARARHDFDPNSNTYLANVVVRTEPGRVPQTWGSGKTPVEAYSHAFGQALPNGRVTRPELVVEEEKTTVKLESNGTVYKVPVGKDYHGPSRDHVKTGLGQAVFEVFVAAHSEQNGK